VADGGGKVASFRTLPEKRTLRRAPDDMVVLTVDDIWHIRERGEAEGKEVD
jgi:hypothetical protein